MGRLIHVDGFDVPVYVADIQIDVDSVRAYLAERQDLVDYILEAIDRYEAACALCLEPGQEAYYDEESRRYLVSNVAD